MLKVMELANLVWPKDEASSFARQVYRSRLEQAMMK